MSGPILRAELASPPAASGGRAAAVRIALRVAWAVALGTTIFLSLYPHEAVDRTFSPSVQKHDAIFHFSCYLVIAALHSLAFAAPARRRVFRALRLASGYALMGLALEVCQALPVVNRSCSLSDAVENSLGAFVGAGLCAAYAALRDRLSSRKKES